MIKIYGLFSLNQIPTIQQLAETDNTEHTNLIELARYHFGLHAHGERVYDGILVCLRGDEMHVYNFKK